MKVFKGGQITHRVASEFKEDLDVMSQHIPVVELISNPGLRSRHWEEISKVMEIKFNYREGTLRELLTKGIENYKVKIEDISENASKEFSLESALNKMEKEWESLKFVVINFKNRGVLIL